MKKPIIDYRRLRPGNLTSPEFSHLLLLLGWVVYFSLFFLTENLIPAESCTPVHMWLDDWIPFCEYFILPYVGWYALIVGSLLWMGLYNIRGFRQLQTYIMITQACAMLMYILWPSRQDLRPEVFPRENLCTWVISLLYRFDTNTGVCPSLHVAYSIGIASVWLKEKQAWTWWKVFVVIAVALICLSTMFIKQHSAVDFFAALPICLLAELLVFRVFYPNPKV